MFHENLETLWNKSGKKKEKQIKKENRFLKKKRKKSIRTENENSDKLKRIKEKVLCKMIIVMKWEEKKVKSVTQKLSMLDELLWRI